MNAEARMEDDKTPAADRPRVVLMGEFSAGKSTLTNILLGSAPLPVQVTATRLPPVHLRAGVPAAVAVDRDGGRHDIAISDLSGARLAEMARIEMTLRADILELCDLVDMPGISDPNMPADLWQDVVRPGDLVVWCTHATQAWRQSEAAVWDRIRAETDGRNILLINQFDKLRNPRDRDRVLRRVTLEAGAKFAAVFPISLRDAEAAGEDFAAWQASGADAFLTRLIGMVLDPASVPAPAVEAPPAPEQTVAPPETPAPAETATAATLPGAGGENVVRLNLQVTPRRVQARPGSRDRLPQGSAVDIGA